MKFKLLGCFLLASRLVFAQTDIMVDHFSGQPIINLPIYKVNDRTLSHNIGLVYDASGVKVNSTSGWVGQNWSMVGAGEVRRELRGLPDDYYSSTNSKRGWLYNNNASTIGNYSYPADGTGLNCTNEGPVNTFINGFAEQDAQPDLYYFSGGDISGSFVFDNTGDINSIKLIPYQDIQVKAYRPINPGPITKFEIITAAGVVYTFDVVENTIRSAFKPLGQMEPAYFSQDYYQYKLDVNYYSSWKLSSIRSSVGEKILLTYGVYETHPSSAVVHALTGTTDTGLPPEILDYTVTEYGSKQKLVSITSPHQSITFNTRTAAHEDFLLDNIVINEINSNASGFVKQINFIYQEAISYNYRRTYLQKVQVTDDCIAYQPYVFEYNDAPSNLDLFNPGSPHQDIWGYYFDTGTTNHKYPKLYIYPSQSGINKISLFQKSGLSDEIVIPGVNRVPSSTSNKGVLSKIKYPGGATASFTFQSHSFLNPITNSVMSGGGLRIGTIIIHDGITAANDIYRYFEYNKPDGTSSGKLLTMPAYWQLSACNIDENETVTLWSAISTLPVADHWKKLIVRTDDNIAKDFDNMQTVGYEYVTEKIGTSQGKTLYQFEVPNVYGDAPSGDWNPTFVHVARFSVKCPAAALNVPSYYQHPFVNQTPYNFKRGILINTKVYKESDATNPELEVINEYQDKAISAATITGLNFERIPVSASTFYYMYGAYKLSTNKLRVLTRTTERIRSKTAPSNYTDKVTDFTYGTDHTFLATATTTNSDGTVARNQNKYVKDYGAPQASDANTDLQVRMIDALYNAGQLGTLVEQVSFETPSGGTEKAYDGGLMLFNDFGTVSAPVIRPNEIYNLVTPGISSFPMSSITGSGVTRVFNKNAAYKKSSSLVYKSFGDLVRMEDNRRQFQSFHPDSLTGLPIVTLMNAEPGEVVYSNFDQDTKFDFNLTAAFTTIDKAYPGRSTGNNQGTSLGGWKESWTATKYITKTFVKRPSSRYIFSAWYNAPTTSGTHSINVIIKNTGGTQLMAQTLTYTIGAINTWYYGELVFDLSSISDTAITIEVRFNGSFPGGGSISAKLDDVSFIPEGAIVERKAYHSAYGPIATINPDGRIIDNELAPNGQMKNVRDREGNILQKSAFTNFLPNGQTAVPISIETDAEIFDNVQTTLRALTACLDISTLQWKVTPASNPTGGTFFNGSDNQAYTFTSSGDFIVTLKITHTSYGSYEVSKTVTVSVTPLSVSICVDEGAVLVDLCDDPWATETDICSGTPGQTDSHSTTFSVSVSGCPSGTYTYQWFWRPYGDENAGWTPAGTNTQQPMMNNFGYDIKCEVNSSCGRYGISNVKSVYVYKSDPSCPDPIF